MGQTAFLGHSIFSITGKDLVLYPGIIHLLNCTLVQTNVELRLPPTAGLMFEINAYWHRDCKHPFEREKFQTVMTRVLKQEKEKELAVVTIQPLKR